MNSMEKTRNMKLGLGIAAGLALALLVCYLGVAAFFSSHFLFGTVVNGIDASGKTIEEVEDAIAGEVNGYEIRIEPREGEAETIRGDEIGLHPVFDGTLPDALAGQDRYAWIGSLFEAPKIEAETVVDYDEEALKEAVEKLELMDRSKMREAKDACISEYSKETGYQIVPEEQGTAVREKKFQKALGKAILSLSGSFSLEEAGCYKKPDYTSKSPELKKTVKKLNKYAGATVTYQFGKKKEVVDGSVISQWLSVKDWKVSLSGQKIEGYVASLAEKYNTAGKPKELRSSYGQDVTVSGGDYGWQIDVGKEAKELEDAIKKGKSVKKEPSYAKTAGSHGANDYGSTYVEVNLTAQHLFYYKDGNLVLESDFVSGNEARDMSTPTGAYGLYYKEKDKILRGEDYATPVSFWMPFNGGVGFHDATWRGKFGGSCYKRNGSHGCVNLPYSVAQQLYENIEAGCAVLVYQLPGTENAQVIAEEQAEEEASPVIAAISAIGEVTPESRPLIENARNLYNGLSGMAQDYVSNYGELEAAEARLAQLDAEAADAQAQAEAQPVIDAINALAGAEVTPDMEGTIRGVREQYNQLSDAARAKVTNYAILEEAERKLGEL